MFCSFSSIILNRKNEKWFDQNHVSFCFRVCFLDFRGPIFISMHQKTNMADFNEEYRKIGHYFLFFFFFSHESIRIQFYIILHNGDQNSRSSKSFSSNLNLLLPFPNGRYCMNVCNT